MSIHGEFGKKGEQLASEYLEKKGYSILRRNYRYLKAEVDIIAQKEGVLAIVEVKTRTTEFLQGIEAAIHRKKIRLLVMAADHYVQEHDLDVEVRFDIITLLHTDGRFMITHLEDAFFPF